MLTSVVWILAGVTAWCVASLALALIVGPMVRSADRAAQRERTIAHLEQRTPPATEQIPLPLAG